VGDLRRAARSPPGATRARSRGRRIVGPRGDTLVAHLVNNLPEPTSIHWHGLRLPAPMDGTQLVQRLVQPGDSFDYRFELPDAGTFWYHSHANETVQIERGLYGAIVVPRPRRAGVRRGSPAVVLDDVKLDRHGNIAKTALIESATAGAKEACS